MFECTIRDSASLEAPSLSAISDHDGQYDFTFENRYHIFHCRRNSKLVYIALDTVTGLTSTVTERKTPIPQEEYQDMIPQVIFSIKYMGDERYKGACAYKPNDLIDYIFRIIMPRYGFAIREQQIQMAKELYAGLTWKKAVLCEAEVGSGKTMAYLVAGFAARLLDKTYRYAGYPVTITTSSIELQQAILEKEIPMLSRMLMDYGLISKPLTAVLRKGREHYFCRRRYYEYMDSLFLNPLSHVKAINTLKSMDLLDTALDLDPLPLSPHLKSRICVKGSCHHCPRAGKCKYDAFLEEATKPRGCDFQITNHNLFLASQKNWSAHSSKRSLIPCNFCIVDEAHKLADAAADVFGYAVSFSEVEDYLRSVKHNGGCNKQERAAYKVLLGRAAVLNRKLLTNFSSCKFSGTEDQCEVEFEMTKPILDIISLLVESLLAIGEWRAPKGGTAHNTAGFLADRLSAFLNTEGKKYWIAMAKSTGVKELCCTPLELKDALAETLWNQGNLHFALTSGTMRGDGSFNYFKEELGLDRIDQYSISEYACESPFDYANHTRLYISENVPDPNANDPDYIPKLASEIVDLIRATGGHTAVLFTSYKVLSAVYDMVERVVHEYPLFRMSRSDRNVIERFKNSKNGVIFASGSMWEGVDCAGDILSSVIIVRLPFPVPNHAMELKREACADTRSFIRSYVIPQMIIKLRQGAGRLIRTENDTGILAILDHRAAQHGGYRWRVLKAFSKYPLAASIQEVSDFMHSVKDESYWEGAVV